MDREQNRRAPGHNRQLNPREAGSGCASLAWSTCCEGPEAAHATAQVLAASGPAAAAAVWPPARPLPAQSALDGSRPGAEALIRTVVLRL